MGSVAAPLSFALLALTALARGQGGPPGRVPEMEGRVIELTRSSSGVSILLSREAPHPERTRLGITDETRIYKKVGQRWDAIRLDEVRRFSWVQVWIARHAEQAPVESIAVVPGPVAGVRGARIRRVGSNELKEHLENRVLPEYPIDARNRGLKGLVLVEVTVGVEGAVEQVKLIRGHPILARAAMEAVKKWKYRPFLQMDRAIPVKGTVVVNFN